VGLGFGAINLVFSWLFPESDDTIAAVLRFYGPMFFLWAFASFRAARKSGLRSGIVTGTVVAAATFGVFVLLNLLRVQLFLEQMTGRADWQELMARFRASGSGSLRAFITGEYLRDVPLKIASGSVIGALMGLIGGSLGRMRSWLAA
jgi:hypothetical protein